MQDSSKTKEDARILNFSLRDRVSLVRFRNGIYWYLSGPHFGGLLEGPSFYSICTCILTVPIFLGATISLC